MFLLGTKRWKCFFSRVKWSSLLYKFWHVFIHAILFNWIVVFYELICLNMSISLWWESFLKVHFGMLFVDRWINYENTLYIGSQFFECFPGYFIVFLINNVDYLFLKGWILLFRTFSYSKWKGLNNLFTSENLHIFADSANSDNHKYGFVTSGYISTRALTLFFRKRVFELTYDIFDQSVLIFKLCSGTLINVSMLIIANSLLLS